MPRKERTSFEELERARDHARAGQLGRAAEVYRAAGERFLEQHGALAAATVLEEGVQTLATDDALLEAKVSLSEQLGGALERLYGDGSLTPVERIAEVFRSAARFWSKSERPFSGQRALCFQCGASKPAAWIRCEACSSLPQLPEERALSLLLSERVCSSDTLDSLSADFMGSFHQHLARSAARHFAEATRTDQILQLPDPKRLVPGDLHSAVDETGRVAALVELISGSDDVARKSAVAELVESVSQRLLASEELASDIEERRRDLKHRFGTNVEIGRIERLSVRYGAAAVTRLGSGFARDAGTGPTRTSVLAVAAVAVEAAREADPRSTLIDFASALANDVLMMDCESQRAEDGAHMNVRELLIVRRFVGDPSLSVRQAADVLSEALGAEITVAKAARLLRREYAVSDPENFPGEQALRA